MDLGVQSLMDEEKKYSKILGETHFLLKLTQIQKSDENLGNVAKCRKGQLSGITKSATKLQALNA